MIDERFWKKWEILLPGLMIVWGGEESVFLFLCVFFKTKNGILKGSSLAIFGRAKGKSIFKGAFQRGQSHILEQTGNLAL